MTREEKVRLAREWLGSRWLFHPSNMSKYRHPANLTPNQARGGAIYAQRPLIRWGLL